MSATPPPASGDYTAVTTTRPWSEFLDLNSLSIPVSLSDSTTRLNQNLTHYRVNYAIISLFILFLGLIVHPISLLLILATLIAWFFLFFYRRSSDPLEIYGFTIDDRFLIVALGVITVLALIFANVWMNLLSSIVISGSVVCLHGIFRVPNVGDDDPYGGLLDASAGAYSEF